MDETLVYLMQVLRVGNSRESITVTAGINAFGGDVPPMAVKGRNSLNEFYVLGPLWYKNDLPK